MRYAFFILIGVVSFLVNGNAEEKLTTEFRVNLHPEKLSIQEDGIFLMTESYGEVALSNVQFDKRGYYTICQIAYICTNCQKQFEQYPDIYDCCESQELNFIGMGRGNADEYLTIQAMLAIFLNHSNIMNEILLCKNIVKFDGSADTDGNWDLSSTYEWENEDKDISCKLQAGVENKDGETSGKIEGTIQIGL